MAVWVAFAARRSASKTTRPRAARSGSAAASAREFVCYLSTTKKCAFAPSAVSARTRGSILTVCAATDPDAARAKNKTKRGISRFIDQQE